MGNDTISKSERMDKVTQRIKSREENDSVLENDLKQIENDLKGRARFVRKLSQDYTNFLHFVNKYKIGIGGNNLELVEATIKKEAETMS